MKSQSISLRGTTYAALKDHANTLGTTPSPLVEEWLAGYAPFGDRLPKDALPPGSWVPFEDIVHAPAEQAAPAHPDMPVDPPVRDEPERTKPFVTHAADPSLKPPTSRDLDGGGIVSF